MLPYKSTRNVACSQCRIRLLGRFSNTVKLNSQQKWTLMLSKWTNVVKTFWKVALLMLYSHSKPAGLYSLSITNFFHCSLSRYHAHGVHDSEVQAQPLTNSQRRQRTMSMNLQNFSVRRAFVSNSKDQQHSFLASSAFAICFCTLFTNLKKMSHLTLRAKRATFTFWLAKIH